MQNTGSEVLFNLAAGVTFFLLLLVVVFLAAGVTTRATSGASRQEVGIRSGSVAGRCVGRHPSDERFRPPAVPLGKADVPGEERLSNARQGRKSWLIRYCCCIAREISTPPMGTTVVSEPIFCR